jgi:hypothetical protein
MTISIFADWVVRWPNVDICRLSRSLTSLASRPMTSWLMLTISKRNHWAAWTGLHLPAPQTLSQEKDKGLKISLQIGRGAGYSSSISQMVSRSGEHHYLYWSRSKASQLCTLIEWPGSRYQGIQLFRKQRNTVHCVVITLIDLRFEGTALRSRVRYAAWTSASRYIVPGEIIAGTFGTRQNVWRLEWHRHQRRIQNHRWCPSLVAGERDKGRLLDRLMGSIYRS